MLGIMKTLQYSENIQYAHTVNVCMLALSGFAHAISKMTGPPLPQSSTEGRVNVYIFRRREGEVVYLSEVSLAESSPRGGGVYHLL